MRYKLVISYDGSNYSGFQTQKDKVTIQSILEECLTKTTREDIKVIASGRTDAGVSAIEQVCHFDAESNMDEIKTLRYTNSILPLDIRILEIAKVESNFHARFNSKKKTYEYLFYIGNEVIPIYDKFATHIGYTLDMSAMSRACECLKGEHDFSAFCASNTSVVNKTRTIYDISINKVDDRLYKLSITGNGFLYNMVRIIMGTLIEIGRGKININDFPSIIDSGDRSRTGKTMPSKGLYLKKVEY